MADPTREGVAAKVERSCPNLEPHEPHEWDFIRWCPGVPEPPAASEYELRCLSPQDLFMLGHALESVYAETGADGDLRWPGSDSRPEELWFLIAMVYGHEGGQRMRPPLRRIA